MIFILAWLVARLPTSLQRLFGVVLGFVAGSVVRYRRAHVELAMERAGLSDPRRFSNKLYRNLGAGIVELLARAGDGDIAPVGDSAFPSGDLGALAVLDAKAHAALRDAVARGPVVIFASHTANWELAAAAAAEALRPLGKKLFVVAKTQSVSAVDAFCMRLRNALGVNVIAPNGAFREAMRALARGDVVVLPIDQVPDRAEHALTVPFLNAPALVDRAPATLAYRAKATVLVAAASRSADAPGPAGLRVEVLETLAKREESDRTWIDRATIEATHALDAFVRQHPADWLWLHRRWKSLPDPQAQAGRRLGFSENPG